MAETLALFFCILNSLKFFHLIAADDYITVSEISCKNALEMRKEKRGQWLKLSVLHLELNYHLTGQLRRYNGAKAGLWGQPITSALDIPTLDPSSVIPTPCLSEFHRPQRSRALSASTGPYHSQIPNLTLEFSPMK